MAPSKWFELTSQAKSHQDGKVIELLGGVAVSFVGKRASGV
jgi:hypothetical protein